jgi:hypothetical protein
VSVYDMWAYNGWAIMVEINYAKELVPYIEEYGAKQFRINQVAWIFEVNKPNFLSISDAYKSAPDQPSMLMRRLCEYSGKEDVQSWQGSKDGIDFLIVSEASKYLLEKCKNEKASPTVMQIKGDRYVPDSRNPYINFKRFLLFKMAMFESILAEQAYLINGSAIELTECSLPQKNIGPFLNRYDIQVSAAHLIPAEQLEKRLEGVEERLAFTKTMDNLRVLCFGSMIAETLNTKELKDEGKRVLANPTYSLDKAVFYVLGLTIRDFYQGDENKG